MLDTTERASAAALLRAAEQDRAPIAPLTESYPGIDVIDAYEIQLDQHPPPARWRAPGCTATRWACPPRRCSR